MIIFDSDILIWASRGLRKAGAFIESIPERAISTITYMEYLQGARNKTELSNCKLLIDDYGFEILPLTANTGHRAAIYVEEYTLAYGIDATDALIAATAVENGFALATSNVKHYKCIPNLKLKTFRP